MMLTASQRQAKRRQKLKDENLYEDYKRKEALRKRLKRAENKKKERELPAGEQAKIQAVRRKQIRERVAKHRAAKNLNVNTPTSPAFKTTQALGRAVSKAKRALIPSLPTTPKRKQAVWQSLVRKYGESPVAETTPTRSTAISEETQKTVQTFYQRDDISRQAPGRKDVVIIRENGGKSKVQARHLTTSVNEVYAMFREIHPDVMIGKSKFAELRPKHVLLSSQLPRNVCLCKYHENFIMAVDTLNKAIPGFPKYEHTLPDELVCAAATQDCWFNQCPNCQDAKLLQSKLLPEHGESCDVTWNVWANDADGKICKMVKEGTSDDLFSHICAILPEFLQHSYIKRNQAESYQKEREAVGDEDFDPSFAMLQVDFSENYTCMFQDEIQSAHWKQNQVSLFTAALWFDGELHPKVVASDNLDHGKDTVIAYIDHLLDALPDVVETISIWSDGPSSQFKNRFVVAAIAALQEKHNVKIRWNFFATSHGKGPVDGIGGSVKRQVWTSVSTRKSVVTDATSFCASAKQASNVEVIEMKTKEIQERNLELNLEEVFDEAPAIKGIKSLHHMQVGDSGFQGYRLTKDVEQLDLQSPSSADMDKFAISSWCVVEYDGTLFPGEIKAILGERYEVSVMVRAGRYWKWPTQEDRIPYCRDQIVKPLSPPILVNAREHYDFPDFA
jgi:hypothetical protein